MKVVIAGSRGITDYNLVEVAIAQTDFSIGEVVCGTARGVDTLGELWAIQHGIPVHKFPADWGRFGRAAGMYRNAEMASYADGAIILWDGESKGTLDMIDRMRRVRKNCEVYNELGERVVAF